VRPRAYVSGAVPGDATVQARGDPKIIIEHRKK
jgi:hypothetical protein